MNKSNVLAWAVLGMMLLASAIQTRAQSLIYGLTTNALVVFSRSGPVAQGPNLTGLGVGEAAVAIDFRPFTGELYVLTGDQQGLGRLYTANPITGVATPVTVVGAITNINGGVGMDFNPVATAGVNALRIVTGSRDNYRITFSGATGTVNYDGKLNTTNVVAGTNAVAAAYINNRGGLPGAGGAGGTTLYIIEQATSSLYVQNPPNAGTLVDAKPLSPGFGAGAIAGFDIDTLNNRAYAIVAQGEGELVEIDLATGNVTFLNAIPVNVSDLAVTLPVSLPSTLVYGLTATNTLVPFTTDSTNVGAVIPITGSGLGGRTFVAIDFRPLNGQLYGLARDALNDDAGRLYTIDPVTGAATELTVTGAQFRLTNSVGMDFNPVALSGANALRVVTGADQDFRLTFSGSTATVIVDGAINPSSADLMAAAYVNNRGGLPGAGGVGGTTLYVVDSVTDTLYIQNPPNNGTLTVPKPLVHDIGSVGGMDILTTTDRALAVFGINGTNGLYEVDLTNGFANFMRPLPSSFVDLAVPIPPVLSSTPSGANRLLTPALGVGPFNVQRADIVSDPFCSVGTIAAATSLTVTNDGPQSFYRIRDLSAAGATRFTVFLSGAAEIPANASTAVGFGTFELVGDSLKFDIAYSGLGSAFSDAHIHLPAESTNSAGPSIFLQPYAVGPLGTNGRFASTIALTLAQKVAILDGKAYVNIHSANLGGGEIRGQIAPTTYRAIARGISERANPTSSTGFGTATMVLIGRELLYYVSYHGLSGTLSDAHIHGRADRGVSAGVQYHLRGGTGLGSRSGILTSRTNLTAAQIGALVDGRAYVNLHSSVVGSGEIRGQVAPVVGEVPFAAELTGAAERPTPVVTTGAGFASATLQGSTLSFTLAYRNLPAVATVAHIHGPAVSTNTAGVLLDLAPYHQGPLGTQGVFVGTVPLTPAMVAALHNGDLYFNIHTALNPAGEIRGQISPTVLQVALNGANEVPPVATPATGYGYVGLLGKQLSLGAHYRDLQGAASDVHFHMPAEIGGSAGPVLFIASYGLGGLSTWGFLLGSQTAPMTDTQAAHFADYLVYLNIHSSAHGGGEIRAHVLP
jgi:hypothetical protein